MIIREAESKMRWTGSKEISLFSNVFGEETSVLIDLIGNDDVLWCNVFLSQSHQSIEYQVDINKAVSKMPDELRMIYKKIKRKKSGEAAIESA